VCLLRRPCSQVQATGMQLPRARRNRVRRSASPNRRSARGRSTRSGVPERPDGFPEPRPLSPDRSLTSPESQRHQAAPGHRTPAEFALTFSPMTTETRVRQSGSRTPLLACNHPFPDGGLSQLPPTFQVDSGRRHRPQARHGHRRHQIHFPRSPRSAGFGQSPSASDQGRWGRGVCD